MIAVVRFGLVMGVETCGGGVTCERSAERRWGGHASGEVGTVGIRREMKDDEDDEDEDDNVGMKFTVVVYNRQFPITGTVPIFFFLMQCSRIQGTEREYNAD